MPETTQTKCPTCDGQPWAIRVAQCADDSRGWRQEAIKCPECNGSRVAKKPVGRVRAFLARVGVRA